MTPNSVPTKNMTNLIRFLTTQEYDKQAASPKVSPLTSPQTEESSSSSGSSSLLLSNDILKSIKKDLLEADINNDGRIDYEELKLILKKYQKQNDGSVKDLWTDDEIENIGDMFFVGLGEQGGSITHRTFLRGVQHTAVDAPSDHNPIHLTSLPDDRCYVQQTPAVANNESLHDVQTEFDKQLLKYIEAKLNLQSSTSSPKKKMDPRQQRKRDDNAEKEIDWKVGQGQQSLERIMA